MPLDATYTELMDKFGFVPANHSAPTFVPIESRRLYNEDGTEVSGHQQIVRTDTMDLLHIASDQYKILDNTAACTEVERVLGESGLDLTDMRRGIDYASGGAKVFVSYILPAHRVTIKPGNDVAMRLLFTNSCDGTTSFKGRCGGYSFVCANGLIIGSDISNFNLRHGSSLDLSRAINGLVGAMGDFDTQAKRWKAWPEIAITSEDAANVFRAMPKISNGLLDHMMHRFLRAIDADVQGGKNLWAAFNVLTAWATYGSDDATQNGPQLVLPGQIAHKGNRGAIRLDREQSVAKVIESDAWGHLELSSRSA